jgi:hypothetical protein
MDHSTIIEKFTFTDSNGTVACCDIEVSCVPELGTLVIATERADNPGMSVTNGATTIALAVARHFMLRLEDLHYIDRWIPGSYRNETPEQFRLARGLGQGLEEFCSFVIWSDASTDKWRLRDPRFRYIPPDKMKVFREEIDRSGTAPEPYQEGRELKKLLERMGISIAGEEGPCD